MYGRRLDTWRRDDDDDDDDNDFDDILSNIISSDLRPSDVENNQPLLWIRHLYYLFSLTFYVLFCGFTVFLFRNFLSVSFFLF